MAAHISLDVYDHKRKKLCNLYDSSLNSPGQAHDIKMVVNINGTKTLTFDMPFVIEKERNFRWDFIKNEYLVRVEVGNKKDWFVIDKPEKKKDKSSINKSVTCSHISLILKTKNIYTTFDDENGIGTLQVLASRVLAGSGWSLGQYDTMLERDDETEKIRSYSTDGKQGAYQMILDLCKLFGAYPVFNGETKTVDLFAQNNKGALREMTIGKDLTALTVDFDSSSIITRLYVEGEYGDFGYVGIDDVEENEHHLTYLLNFDYYREIGLFTEEHEAALAHFYEVMPVITESIRTTEAQIQTAESTLANLWGICSLVYWPVENGAMSDTPYTYGTVAESAKTIAEEDELVIVGKTTAHPNGEYRKAKAGLGGAVTLKSTDVAVIKYLLKASGTIGGKEVGIETKESLIATLQAKIDGTSTITYSTKKKAEFAAQIDAYEKEIDAINEGMPSKDAQTLLRESKFASWLRTVKEYALEQDDLNLLLCLNNRDETLLSEFGDLYEDVEELLAILKERQSSATVLGSAQLTELTGRQSKEALSVQMDEMDSGNVVLTAQAGAAPTRLASGGWSVSGDNYRPYFYIFPVLYQNTNPAGNQAVYALNAIQADGTVLSQSELGAYANFLASSPNPLEADRNTDSGLRVLMAYHEAVTESISEVIALTQMQMTTFRNACDEYYSGGLYTGSFWSWLVKDTSDALAKLDATDTELWYDDDTVMDAVPGLHALYGQACDLFLSLQELYTTRAEKQAEQAEAEAEFQVAMGDLLRDGYWNDDTYTVGQEDYLYKDAVDMLAQMSRPTVKYKVSRVSLSTILGYSRDDLEINMRVRLYDADLAVNDLVYIASVTMMLDDPSKDEVTISNEDIALSGGSLSDLLSRLTSLADMVEQKNALYSRASAISPDGTLMTQKLEGAINLTRNRLAATASGWYTDANGNIIFESADGQSAMMLCGAGMMIAYGKTDAGEWNWRTMSTGEGIVADTITAGTMSADRIQAGTITVDHLRSGENGVGAMIDLSQNGSLTLAVQNGMNTVQQNLDAANAQIQSLVQTVRTDMNAVVKQSSEVLQTANSITTEVSTLRSDMDDFQEQFSTYERFDETGLTIGKTENGQDTGMQLHLSNEKLSFLDNDTEVAYMSGQKLYITEARITNRLAIAVMRKGYFDWIATGDGLGLKWRAAGTE